ncbi:hypothetical protein KM043_015022 [Ampulex compressa]|nr:hypothetical protein KM043_015022 [Ampulex compressa]
MQNEKAQLCTVRLICTPQYGGEPGRRLSGQERPLEIQDQFLQKLGYQEATRRSRLGVDPELRHLIAFHVGQYSQTCDFST